MLSQEMRDSEKGGSGPLHDSVISRSLVEKVIVTDPALCATAFPIPCMS